jgi:hypothetical protein
MGVRQLNEVTALTVSAVSCAFFITCLHVNTQHSGLFVIYNLQAKKNNILPLLHRISCN